MGKLLLDRIYAMMDGLERLLRLDRLSDRRDLSRARAVYIIGSTMILIQSANLISMTIAYGGFTGDHVVSLLACGFLLLMILALRFSASFHFFAALLSILLIISVTATAYEDLRGIHTSLLPFLMFGPILNAFVSGRKAVVVYTIVGSLVIWGLFLQSQSTTLFAGADPEIVALVAYQRAFQGQIIMLMIGVVAFFVTAKLDETTTQLEDMIEDAKRTEQAKTQFFSNMSHELRTPLNGVIGMSGLLLRTELDAQQRQYAEIVNECSTGLVDLIGSVLDLSKLDADKFTLAEEAFDLHALFEGLHALYRPLAESKNIALVLDWDAATPYHVIGDPVRLRQIAHNLIGNALKFTDIGEVRISVRSDRSNGMHRHVFFVADTGRGIAKEAQSRVFERFEQDGTSDGGTGLGLAIARSFVEAMGGELKLHSREGEGTVFRYALELPTIDTNQRLAG